MNEQYYYPTRGKAADFRRRAKQALKGSWWMAAIVTLLAVIFGGVTLAGGVGSVTTSVLMKHVIEAAEKV